MNDKKDRQIIILSVVVAIFMWAFVITTTNPMLSKTIRNVPLSIRNLETLQNQGFELVGKEQIENVNVKVEANRDDMRALESDDLVASIDLGSPSEGIRSLNVKVDTPSGVRVVDIDPKQVNLKIEKVVEKIVPVNLLVTDKLKEGRIVEVNEFYPQEIKVRGIRSQVDKVSELRVDVDKESYLNGKIHNISVIALDNQGEIVENVSLSSDEVSISYKVSQTKELSIKLITKGNVAEGYEIFQEDITPKKIIVKGDNATISKLKELETEEIDISNLKEDFEGKAEIILPNFVEVYDGEDSVSYKIKVRKKEDE